MQDQDQDKLSFPKFGDDEIFASQSDKERFKCSICWGIVCDPMFCSNLKCGKPFCKACLDENREKNKQEVCSLCKNKGFREISYIEKDSIDNIKLRYKYFGCFQFLKYSEYMNHLENCKHRVIHCKNKNCNAQGNKAFIEEHKKKCNYRIIKCECEKEMVYHLFKKHIKKDCPEALIPCRYCDDKIKRKNLEEHKKNNKNAECIKDKYKKSQEEIKTMNKELAEKINEIKSVKKNNSNLKKEIEKLTKLLEGLRTLINNGLNEPNAIIEENH
jgi:hypothetical protein